MAVRNCAQATADARGPSSGRRRTETSVASRDDRRRPPIGVSSSRLCTRPDSTSSTANSIASPARPIVTARPSWRRPPSTVRPYSSVGSAAVHAGSFRSNAATENGSRRARGAVVALVDVAREHRRQQRDRRDRDDEHQREHLAAAAIADQPGDEETEQGVDRREGHDQRDRRGRRHQARQRPAAHRHAHRRRRGRRG